MRLEPRRPKDLAPDRKRVMGRAESMEQGGGGSDRRRLVIALTNTATCLVVEVIGDALGSVDVLLERIIVFCPCKADATLPLPGNRMGRSCVGDDERAA